MKKMPVSTSSKRGNKPTKAGRVPASAAGPPKFQRPQPLPRRPKQHFFTLRNLVLAVLFYAGFHRLFTCPTYGYPPKATAPPVCRTVYKVEKDFLQPGYVRLVEFFKASPTGKVVLNRYDENVRPHVDPLLTHGRRIHNEYIKPAATQAQIVFKTYSEPALKKAKALYVQHVDPHVQMVYGAAKKEYDARLGKHVEKAYVQGNAYYVKHVHPHVGPLAKSANTVYENFLYPAYERSCDILYHASIAAAEVYQQYLGPLAAKTFVVVKDTWTTQVSPAAIEIWQQHGRPLYVAALHKLGIEVDKVSAAGKAATKAGKTGFDKATHAAGSSASKAEDAAKAAASKASTAAKGASVKANDARKASVADDASSAKAAEAVKQAAKGASKKSGAASAAAKSAEEAAARAPEVAKAAAAKVAESANSAASMAKAAIDIKAPAVPQAAAGSKGPVEAAAEVSREGKAKAKAASVPVKAAESAKTGARKT